MNGKEFICQLSNEAQGRIIGELVKRNRDFDFALDIQSIMAGRLCDLEPEIDWVNLMADM